MQIRDATEGDAAEIASIYNHYILTSHATFETEPLDEAEAESRIRDAQADGYPFIVAVDAGSVAGFAYGHRFRPRQAYRSTVEVSIYIRPGYENRGTGKRIYGRLLGDLKDAGYHAIIAAISLPNEASIKLHEGFGFTKAAHLRETGRKFDRWIDVGYWQLLP